MLSLRERREEESKREWADTLKEEGFANDAALEGAIKKLENDLKKARKKEANEEDVEVSTLHLSAGALSHPHGTPGRAPIIPSSRRSG